MPPNIEVARRLEGKPLQWGDYARAILKQARESFTDYGSRCGTGPWYVVWNPTYEFKMVPILGNNYYHSFRVTPSCDSKDWFWVFEVIA